MRRIIATVCAAVCLSGIPPKARAAKIIGNGGNVFVCPGQDQEVLLLDFVEADLLRRWIRITDPAPQRYIYYGKLASLFEKIAMRFPKLADRLQEEVIFFEANHVRLDKLVLDSSGDSYHKFSLEGCQVEQAINQAEPLFAEDPTFIVSHRLWKRMSELDKAGLVIHEALFRIGLSAGVEHSLGVRHLTGMLFHENLAEISDMQWIEAFSWARVNYFEKNGLSLPLFDFLPPCQIVPGNLSCREPEVFQQALTHFSPEGSLDSIRYPYPESFTFSTPELHIRLSANTSVVKYNRSGKAEIQFEGGHISLVSDERMGLMEKNAMLLASGVLDPETGHFCGKISSVKYITGKISRPNKKYCAKLSDFIRKKVPGVN